MRTLLLDIETAPNTAYVWRLFKENVPLARLIETSYVMCWAAKWLDAPEVHFSSVYHNGQIAMLQSIRDMLAEADVVIHFNGKAFDIPTLNREFLIYGLVPPAPYKQVDLMLVAKDKFRFVSNKLDHIAQELDCGKKHDTSFDLWVKCMSNDPDAWVQMENYNIQDVMLLERVYKKMIPWITKGPNIAVYADGAPVCPSCGSVEVERRGYTYTTVGKFQRYHCTSCGAWHRDGTNLISDQKHVLRPVAS